MRLERGWATAGVAGIVGVAVIGLAACSGDTSSEAASVAPTSELTLTSSAFSEGGSIPPQYTCDGEDISPPLSWDGVPEGTQSLALIVEDPDAGGFVHWVLTDIPFDLPALFEGQGDQLGTPGATSFGEPGWGGPCPPSGEHRYVFTLYALSEMLTLGPSAGAVEARAAMGGKILGQAQLSGVYTRS
jgi:hypothetical protein